MENTSKTLPLSEREIFYYRQRQKNRVLEMLAAFFAEEAERTGITKKDIADKLIKDPAQISRWFSGPSNLTLDTISDLLLALEAEIDQRIVRFSDRAKPNYEHPLIDKLRSPNIRDVSNDANRQVTHIRPAITGTSTIEGPPVKTVVPGITVAISGNVA
jgi:transcriptional regulator with XRE-family HTH domain